MLLPNLFSILCICFCVLVLHTFVAEGAIGNQLPVNDVERQKNHNLEDSISTSIFSFGMELMKGVLREPEHEDNVLVSPLSAYLALSMIHLAAEEKTRANLNAVLKLSDSGLNVSMQHETLGSILTKIPYNTDEPDEIFPQIALSNGFFVDNDLPINDSYVQLLRKYYKYNATVTHIEFKENIEAIKIINSWISVNTRNRIENFFSEPLSRNTHAVLTSALYFKANWQKPFQKTTTEKFKIGKNDEVDVPMMTAEDYVPYYSNADLKYETIELSYEGDKHAMMIVLPHTSQTVDNLLQYNQLIDFQKYQREMKTAAVEYKIPKMKMFTKKSLVEALQLKEILKAAQLRAMTPNWQMVEIQDIKQAAELEVDENGTIATAVTVVEMGFRMGRPIFVREKLFYVDRPFIVYIIHKPTHTLLFSGVVHNPAERRTKEDAEKQTKDKDAIGGAEGRPGHFLPKVLLLFSIFYLQLLLN